MRLGYSYRISWGGSPIFFKYNPDLPVQSAGTGGGFAQNNTPAPGAKLMVADERWYAYLGFKTSLLLDRNPAVLEQVAVYGGLAGAGFDAIPNRLRIEANGGYFDRGTNPLFFGTSQGSNGQTFTSYPVNTYGGTLQVSVFDGISPTTSADFALYRNDPMVSAVRYFQRPVYRPGFNWMASAEGTILGSTLQDVDHPDSTKTQLAFAADVNLRAQIRHWRLRGDVETRSLSYVLINQPSLVPFQDFPKGASVMPEVFGVLGFDYFVERLGLTAGASLGIESPASFTPPPGQTDLGSAGGQRGRHADDGGDDRGAQRRRLLDPSADGRQGEQALRGADRGGQGRGARGLPRVVRGHSAGLLSERRQPDAPGEGAGWDEPAAVQPAEPDRVQPHPAGALLIL
jgi:hypothetical protein